MSKPLLIGKRGLTIVIWTCAALMLGASVMTTLVLHRVRQDAAYLNAVVSAFQHDDGLKALRAVSETDPAFMPDGMLTADARPSRCEAVATSLDSFQRQWLDATSYEGHKINSHLIAAVLMSIPEAAAARNGCIPGAAFDAFVARIEAIRDYDLGIHTVRDLVARLPLPAHDGYWPAFFTLHGMQVQQWRTLLNDRELAMLRCNADARCDIRGMMKKMMGDSQG